MADASFYSLICFYQSNPFCISIYFDILRCSIPGYLGCLSILSFKYEVSSLAKMLVFKRNNRSNFLNLIFCISKFITWKIRNQIKFLMKRYTTFMVQRNLKYNLKNELHILSQSSKLKTFEKDILNSIIRDL